MVRTISLNFPEEKVISFVKEMQSLPNEVHVTAMAQVEALFCFLFPEVVDYEFVNNSYAYKFEIGYKYTYGDKPWHFKQVLTTGHGHFDVHCGEGVGGVLEKLRGQGLVTG